MWLEAEPDIFQRFLGDAAVYWRGQVDAGGTDAVVFVEALHHDLRVHLRNLTMANAIRRVTPARLVVLTGSDPRWLRAFDAQFDTALLTELAEAYGASEVIDVHARADAHLAAAVDVAVPGISPEALAECAEATYCRLELIPRVTPEERAGAAFAACRDRVAALSAVFDDLLAGGRPVALVTSHVDYDQWGLAVQAAQRAAVPVVHTQSTGSLKAYTLFPDNARGEATLRAELTPQIGEFFAERVWAQRDRYRHSAERVAWRARSNLGRPSWWRGGGTASVELANAVERRQVRGHAAARFGFDPDRPVVVVFNHAVSDALGTNREAFGSLAEWFEQTAAYAHSERAVNWLFLDHPSQVRYDTTNFFGTVAQRYAGAGHLAFRASRQLSKNILWSLADLGVTVRGSVSNEMPAYGIPVVQAGWSEWSACGLSIVADDQAAYWRTLDVALATLTGGGTLITADQVARARLWLWLYRSAADVVSGLVPAWDLWPADHLLQAVRVHMRQVEPDGEPVFDAVERMWQRREPLLTRTDLPPASGAVPALPHTRVADAPALARD
ncbi:MAG TPA: hypothetical protein VES42_27925 [Pilimelia sp.]|nr:hypothetical protein [Pilimelia sp.]